MNVLVIRQFVRMEDKDLRVVLVGQYDDRSTLVSPVLTLKNRARHDNVNSNLVYGHVCTEFFGVSILNLNITVAECVSGDLKGWK